MVVFWCFCDGVAFAAGKLRLHADLKEERCVRMSGRGRAKGVPSEQCSKPSKNKEHLAGECIWSFKWVRSGFEARSAPCVVVVVVVVVVVARCAEGQA